jgi:3'(2'), 5'-bisphosphate nucleotidase
MVKVMWADPNVRARVCNEVAAILGHEAALATDVVADSLALVRSIEAGVASETVTKSDASPVTVADFSVQVLVALRLARDFPGDPMIAEEDAAALRTNEGKDLLPLITGLLSGKAVGRVSSDQVLDCLERRRDSAGPRFWAVDPIDGTKGLLRGGQYAIALALVVDGVVRCGVIGCPRLSLDAGYLSARAGGIAVATRGRGTRWCGGDGTVRPLHVSSARGPRLARVLHSAEAAHSDVPWFLRTLARLGVTTPPILMDSQAKHVVLAAGGGDVLLRFPPQSAYHEAIWDQAAGSIVIEEAGGRITDLAGWPLDFTVGHRLTSNRGTLASNGELHPAVLAAVARAGSDLGAGRIAGPRPQ